MEKKKLDDLFREGLNNPEVSYDEMHWIAMEEKLVNNRKKKVRLIWLSSLSAAAAVILVFLVIWWPITSDQSVEVVKKEDSIISKKTHIDKPVPPVVDQIVKSDKALLKNTSPTISIPLLEDKSNERTGRLEAISENIYKDTLTVQAGTNGLLGKVGQSLKPAPVYSFNTSDAEILSEPKLTINRERRPSYLTILAAPDLTSVRGAGNPQLSQNIGVLYTLPLSKKLSVSGGVLYARKNYNSPYSFYRPKIQRSYGATPSQVDAACDVLDVPIELNYQVYNKGATRITLNGGASSYFMLREQYEFSYDTGDPYKDKQRTNYEVRGQNNHPFGVANISATFEQQLNNQVTIGVRPFVKLPLTGIGYGRTKLDSKGLAVSVSFKLGK